MSLLQQVEAKISAQKPPVPANDASEPDNGTTPEDRALAEYLLTFIQEAMAEGPARTIEDLALLVENRSVYEQPLERAYPGAMGIIESAHRLAVGGRFRSIGAVIACLDHLLR